MSAVAAAERWPVLPARTTPAAAMTEASRRVTSRIILDSSNRPIPKNRTELQRIAPGSAKRRTRLRKSPDPENDPLTPKFTVRYTISPNETPAEDGFAAAVHRR